MRILFLYVVIVVAQVVICPQQLNNKCVFIAVKVMKSSILRTSGNP